MLIQTSPPLYLTYGLNVHPGEDLAAVKQAIETWAVQVKARVCPDALFGLGLRLSGRAARELLQGHELDAFRRLLDQNGMYVFTINGFPYGHFHGAPIKEQVYAPDWRDPARAEYTVNLTRILAALLPEGVRGSISTVPGSFRPWIRNESDVKAMVANLAACAEAVARLCESKRRHVTIALEPEPGCWIETTDEAIRFFLEHVPESARPWLGLCLDTCHMAVQFEDAAESVRAVQRAGVTIAKIQLSAAVETDSDDVIRALRDPIYLHQTRVRSARGTERIYLDMPDRLEPGTRARIHFHVPLYCREGKGWTSTSDMLSPVFFASLRAGATEHVEVETYTFHVLPSSWRAATLDESLARELQWALDRFARSPGTRMNI